MSLVRYDTNVFFLEDVYGLDLYDKSDHVVLHVILRGGETSFKMKFDSRDEAERVFDAICEELDVRDLDVGETESVAAE